MATIATQVLEMKRGGHPAVGWKVGLVENTIDISSSTVADVYEAIKFEAYTVVLNAGIEIVVPATNTVALTAGKGAGAESVPAINADEAAGTKKSGTAAEANVFYGAGDTLDLSVAGDVGGTGQARVWAVVADVEDLAG